MQSYLDYLRTKPHHVRKKIAHGLAGVITFFIFMFWLSTLGIGRFSTVALAPVNDESGPNIIDSKTTAIPASAATTPFEKVSGGVASVFSAFQNLKDSISQGFGVSYNAETTDNIIVTPGSSTTTILQK